MKTCTFMATVVALSLATPAFSQQTDHRLGDHPAVVVQRLHAKQGYDYASKFYPHPAWLYLYGAPPDELAMAAAQRKKQQEEQSAAADRLPQAPQP